MGFSISLPLSAFLGYLARVTGYYLAPIIGCKEEDDRKKVGKILQLIIVAISEFLLYPISIIVLFGFVSTLFYLLILFLDLLLYKQVVQALRSLWKRIVLAFKKVIETISKSDEAKSILERTKPIYGKLTSLANNLLIHIEKVKQHWIVKVLLGLLRFLLFLFRWLLYPVLIKSLFLDFPIWLLQRMEEIGMWVSENIIALLLGEIIAEITRYINILIVRVPWQILEKMRGIFNFMVSKLPQEPI